MKNLSMLQKLRRYNVLFSPHLMLVGSRSNAEGLLHTVADLCPDSPLAAIPSSSILTAERVVDSDKMGFCADQSFLNGQSPHALLAHFASLQYCLQDPWFQLQLSFFKGKRSNKQLFFSLKQKYVMAPENVFNKAVEYIEQRSIIFNGKPALLPFLDFFPLSRQGNVNLRYISSLPDIEILSNFQGVKKKMPEGAFVIASARHKILAGENLFLHENQLVSSSPILS